MTLALRQLSAMPSRLCSLPVVGTDGCAPSLSAAREVAGPSDGDRATGGLQRRLGVDGADASEESVGYAHRPVMLEEVLELFAPVPDGILLDATLGGAGHALALLQAHPGLELVGIDRDLEALAAARARLARFSDRARCYHARFDALAEILELDRRRPGAPEAPPRVTAVLFDLGVSSHQLDVAERGFSYRAPGPLDMRMDTSSGRTAAELLEALDEHELAELLASHGEERFARRIAAAIVAARPIGTTNRLAEVVASAVPAAARRRGHPARRVFQALRAAVNSELEILAPALDAAIDVLAPAGRCVVLAYHSGEDRIVKDRFVTAATGGCTCPPGLPCVCGASPRVRLLTRGARKPRPAEVGASPRSRSARLRAVERLAPASQGQAL
jgi:16S rRNA (cytosine1402-N4)-methyltransferase